MKSGQLVILKVDTFSGPEVVLLPGRRFTVSIYPVNLWVYRVIPRYWLPTLGITILSICFMSKMYSVQHTGTVKRAITHYFTVYNAQRTVQMCYCATTLRYHVYSAPRTVQTCFPYNKFRVLQLRANFPTTSTPTHARPPLIQTKNQVRAVLLHV